MAKFKIEATWFGKRSETVVEIVEADNACDALDRALPGQWYKDEFMSADIKITQHSS